MKFRSKVLLAAVVSSTILGGGMAYAFFSTGGGGTGTATVGRATGVTIANGDSVGPLAPGDAPRPIAIEISNPVDGQYVPAVQVGLGTMPDDCGADNFRLANDVFVVDARLAEGATTYAVDVPTIAMLETGSNQDACKGITVPLVFTVVPLPTA